MSDKINIFFPLPKLQVRSFFVKERLLKNIYFLEGIAKADAPYIFAERGKGVKTSQKKSGEPNRSKNRKTADGCINGRMFVFTETKQYRKMNWFFLLR